MSRSDVQTKIHQLLSSTAYAQRSPSQDYPLAQHITDAVYRQVQREVVEMLPPQRQVAVPVDPTDEGDPDETYTAEYCEKLRHALDGAWEHLGDRQTVENVMLVLAVDEAHFRRMATLPPKADDDPQQGSLFDRIRRETAYEGSSMRPDFWRHLHEQRTWSEQPPRIDIHLGKQPASPYDVPTEGDAGSPFIGTPQVIDEPPYGQAPRQPNYPLDDGPMGIALSPGYQKGHAMTEYVDPRAVLSRGRISDVQWKEVDALCRFAINELSKLGERNEAQDPDPMSGPLPPEKGTG